MSTYTKMSRGGAGGCPGGFCPYPEYMLLYRTNLSRLRTEDAILLCKLFIKMKKRNRSEPCGTLNYTGAGC